MSLNGLSLLPEVLRRLAVSLRGWDGRSEHVLGGAWMTSVTFVFFYRHELPLHMLLPGKLNVDLYLFSDDLKCHRI